MNFQCDTMKKSNHKQHKWLYEEVLVMLLIIGCVETNPGPAAQYTRIKYEKTKEHSKPTGPNYEWKLACLLFLRQIQKNEPFLLASNIKKGGKFDDIVLLIPGKSASFIQLKHMENKKSLKPENFCSMTGDFSFLKFYKSYCEIISLSSTDKEFKQCGAVKNFEFVLFTNSDYIDTSKCDLNTKGGILDTGGQWFLVDKYRNPVLKDQFEEWKILADALSEVNRLVKDNQKDSAVQKIQDFQSKNQEIQRLVENLVEDPGKSEKVLKDFSGCENFSLFKDFFSQMKVYIKQASESDLESKIKFEIKEIFGANERDTNDMVKEIQKHIYRWWDKCSYYLQPSEPFWCEMIDNRLASLRQEKEEELNNLDILFDDNDTGLNEITENIREGKIIHISPSQNQTILSCLKSYQSLEKLNLKKDAILMNYSTLEKRKVEVLNLLRRKWCDVIVIECNIGLCGSFDALFSEICSYIQQDMKLITIGTFEVNAKLQRFLKGKIVCDSSCLAQCTTSSQDKLLQRIVNFQGKPVPLSKLVALNSTITDEICDDIFCHIINHKSLNVGEGLQKAIEYYRPRTLLHYVHVKKNNLKACIEAENAQIVFAVSGMKLRELKDFLPNVAVKIAGQEDFFPETEPKKVYSIRENDTDFKELCRHHTNCCIHWFHLERGIAGIVDQRLTWRRSRGNMDVVHQTLDMEKWCIEEPKKITDISDRIVLIVAKPGMGKTTLLTYLAAEEKNINPDFWVVNINLKKYGEVFYKIKEQNISVDVNNVISFLGDQIIGSDKDAKNQFLKMVFKENMMERGNVIILLDAYDEISPDYTDIVSSMARVLIDDTKICKLWFTTRPNKGKKLEEDLCTLAYTLKPFGRNDQKIFLQEVWRQKIQNFSEEYLLNFVSKLLSVADRSFSEKDRDLTGIPLQTKMLAEVYEEYLLESKELPDTLNMPELYRCFMEKQFERFFKKQNVNPNFIGIDGMCESHKEYLVKGHKMSGVLVKFPSVALEELEGFNIEERFLQELANDKERTGIIDGIFDDKKPQFTHQTYAEYFCALWLSENYEHNQLLLRRYIFSPDFEIVRNMLDHMLTTDHPLHSSILNGNWEAAKQHMDKAACLDNGQRTALHLAAGCGNNYAVDIDHSLSYTIYTNTEDETDLDRIVRLLLQNGSQVNAVDGVLGWTPLQYANHVPGGVSFRMLGMLLEAGAEDKDGTLIRNEQLCNKQYIQDNIRTAIQEGYFKLTKWLINNKKLKPDLEVPCENIRYSNTTRVMHLAAENGEVAIMKLLLEKKANIETEDSKGNTALHAAAQSGNQLSMKFLLNKGSLLDVQNKTGDTPLHLAANNGKIEAVSFLLEKGADSSIKNKNGMTPLRVAANRNRIEVVKYLCENCDSSSENNLALHDAIAKANLEIVEYLANKVDDINYRNWDGKSALQLALFKSNQHMLRSLVEAGADVNCKDSIQETPIYTAIEQNDIETCKYLASKGASFDVKNINGETPLHRAVELGELCIVKYLADRCPDINAKNIEGVTPLMKAVVRGDMDIICNLLEKGANPLVKDRNENSLLHCAAKSGQCDLMDYILSHFQLSSQLKSLNKEGETPMMAAAVNKNWNIVKLLSNKYGSKIYVKKQNGDTLLHVAVEQEDGEITCWLLLNNKRYFNVKQTKNRQGKTALHIAAKFNKIDMLQCLLKFCKSKFLPVDFEGNSPLHYACASNAATTEFLINNFDKKEINKQNNDKYTPLHKAVAAVETSQCAEIILLLLYNGANPKLSDKEGRTPLCLAVVEGQPKSIVEHLANYSASWTGIPNPDLDLSLYIAIWYGRWNLLPCLREAGANILSNMLGLHPIHRAAERGEMYVLLYLLDDNGTEDVNVPDSYAITPLHYAAFQGHSEVVIELLNRGANINCRDKFGNTPLHCTARQGHSWLTKYLIKNGAKLYLKNKSQQLPLDIAANDLISDCLLNAMSNRRQSVYERSVSLQNRRMQFNNKTTYNLKAVQ